MNSVVNIFDCEKIKVSKLITSGDKTTSWRDFTFTGQDGSSFKVSVFHDVKVELPNDLTDRAAPGAGTGN